MIDFHTFSCYAVHLKSLQENLPLSIALTICVFIFQLPRSFPSRRQPESSPDRSLHATDRGQLSFNAQPDVSSFPPTGYQPVKVFSSTYSSFARGSPSQLSAIHHSPVSNNAMTELQITKRNSPALNSQLNQASRQSSPPSSKSTSSASPPTGVGWNLAAGAHTMATDTTTEREGRVPPSSAQDANFVSPLANRPYLCFRDLEPRMDGDYAKQLVGWDTINIKVPNPTPEPTPGPHSNKPFVMNYPNFNTSSFSTATYPSAQPQPPVHYYQEYSVFVGDLAPETSNSDLVAVFRNPFLGLRSDREPKFIRPFLSSLCISIVAVTAF